MKTDETLPEHWYLLAKERMEAADALLATRGACYSAVELLQESVERYLKGFLIGKGWPLQRIHNSCFLQLPPLRLLTSAFRFQLSTFPNPLPFPPLNFQLSTSPVRSPLSALSFPVTVYTAACTHRQSNRVLPRPISAAALCCFL